MSGGGFYIESGKNGQLPQIRFATRDRQTGATMNVSEPLCGFETVVGESFSLVPSATKPWFKVEDGGGNCLYGKLKNYPGADPDKIFKTDRIVAVTTQSGEVIPTLLALTEKPYEGHVVILTPEQFGIFFSDLLGDAVRGSPEGDSETEKPNPPKNKGLGKGSSSDGPPPPAP